ncbi:MAG: hypothetical protein ABII18_05865 [bacterium]|nr:hypothetical protein [bacterium]MBU1916827.1 hypothetical protein [bacterium]
MGFVLEKVNIFHKPDRREKIIFFATLLGFMFAFVKSCWLPSFETINKVNTEIDALKTIKALAVSHVPENDNEPFFLERTNEAPDVKKISGWAKHLVNNPDIILMREFSSPMLLRDLKMLNIEFLETENKESIVLQPFVLYLEGSFISLEGYLQRLESLPILLITHSINIDIVDEKRGRVTAEIKGTAYGWH